MPPHDCHVTVRGKRWKLAYVRMSDGVDGDCDPPNKPGKEIRINRRLRKHPHTLCETLIHEILHAAMWVLDEEAIDTAAIDMARILYQQGLRFDNQPSVPASGDSI